MGAENRCVGSFKYLDEPFVVIMYVLDSKSDYKIFKIKYKQAKYWLIQYDRDNYHVIADFQPCEQLRQSFINGVQKMDESSQLRQALP
jgi:hypothetical protein